MDPTSLRQPKSLKSLASYKVKAHEPTFDDEEDNAYEVFLGMENSTIDQSENEMQIASVKFVDVDSDLTEIFSRNRAVSFQEMHIPSVNDYDEMATLHHQLKEMEDKQVATENKWMLEREKCEALRQELNQMDSDMKGLRADFREKEDQVNIFLSPAYRQCLIIYLVKAHGARSYDAS